MWYSISRIGDDRMSEKGFTLIEIIAVIAIIGILSGIALGAVSKYQLKARNETYKNYESNLKSAAQDYLLYNQMEIPESGGTKTITSDELISGGYLDEMTDPIKNNKKCTATVVVTNKQSLKTNGETTKKDNSNIDSSNTMNLDLEYKVHLSCEGYTS